MTRIGILHDVHADYWAVYGGWRARLAKQLRRFQEQLDRSPPKFLKQWDRAWRSRDVAQLIGLGMVLRNNGQLTENAQLKLGCAYIADEHFDEAAQLLHEPIGDAARSPGHWFWLAMAFAGAGRFEDARAAAARALDLRPEFSGAEALRKKLKAAIWWREAASSERTWPVYEAWIEACLAVNARTSAAEALREALAHPPSLEPQSAKAAIAVARLGLSLVKSREIAPLIAQLRAAYPDDEDARTLALEQKANLSHRARLAAQAQEAPAIGPRPVLKSDLSDAERKAIILALSPIARAYEDDYDVMASLAYHVGEQVLAESGPTLVESEKPKIFNLIPFYNEYMLTKIRMHEMAEWVDYFVFVEAGQTFTGMEKGFNFEPFQEELEDFKSKILYLKIPSFPAYLASAWAREFYQRDMAAAALTGLCGPEDLVLITDADEVVDRRALRLYNGSVASLRMTVNKYFFNYQPDSGNPYSQNRAGVLCKGKHVQAYGSSYLRSGVGRYKKDWNVLPNAGWHFTSINDAARISEKFRAYSHQGRAKAVWRQEATVDAFLQRLRTGDLEKGWKRGEIDQSLPDYIRQHQGELQAFLL